MMFVGPPPGWRAGAPGRWEAQVVVGVQATLHGWLRG